MNVTKYLPILAICMMTTGCNSGKQSQSGIDLANLDTTAFAGTDFYQYACGGWMKNNPLTDEYSRFGSFDQLAENNRVQLQGLIEELATTQHPDGSIAQKVGGLYNIAMDSAKLNNDGIAPIMSDLNQIASIKTPKDVYMTLAEMRKNGMQPFFYMYVGADDMNSDMNMVHAGQSGLGMGERDYYLEEGEDIKAIREAYKKHIVKMFELAGYDDASAKKAMESVMKIENRLAKISRTNVDLRDPIANYNKFNLEQLNEKYPSMEWGEFLNASGMTEVKEIDLGQPEFFAEVADIIQNMPIEDQVAYLQWNLINSASSFLSDDMVNQNFDFYGRTMSGKKELQPRWKRAVGSVNGMLGEAVGQMYVEKFFPPQAKAQMLDLVGNLQKSLGERINNLSWMSNETKEKAQEKLATFHVKIGYPDKWKDYSNLAIINDSYWDNVKRASQWAYKEMTDKIGKTVDKDEWFMNPQTVNAYYNPTTNEICFPAAILQYPFFDMNADEAFNYGAIGVVIGHEMTHGFDDMGRQYDKDGNLNDWWTEEDAKNFDERSKVLVDYFDNIEVAPGLNANGRFTLGENIADHGGLQISYQAYKNATANKPLEIVDGFTPEQRFFLAYANVWAGNIRPEEILRLTKVDEHSLGRWRVNGALPHINAWYEAFDINANDPMYIAEENRTSIW